MITPRRTRWIIFKRFFSITTDFVARSWRGIAAIGAVLAVVAAGIQDFDKVLEWYRKNTIPLGPVVDQGKEFFDVGKVSSYVFSGDGDDLDRYVLILGISPAFKESAEDLKPFLNTLSKVERLFHNGRESKVVQLFPVLLVGSGGIPASKIYVAVRFNSKPVRGDVLLVDFGPVRQEFTLGDLAWVKQTLKGEGEEVKNLDWFSAFGLGEFTLAEPTWTIIRKVRLLVAPVGKPDVLEAVIDNRSSSDVFINDLYIEATQKKEHTVMCNMPIPRSYARLSFEKLSVISSDTKAWSEIDGEKFAAQAAIGGACGSTYELEVHAPVRELVRAKQMGSVIVKMSDMPWPPDKFQDGKMVKDPLVKISNWEHVGVGFNGGDGDVSIFPKKRLAFRFPPIVKGEASRPPK